MQIPSLLDKLPFFNSDEKLEELKAELAKADGVSPEMDKLDWWRKHELSLWSKACKTVLLAQPSSAPGERIISLLFNSFTETQTSILNYAAIQWQEMNDKCHNVERIANWFDL